MVKKLKEIFLKPPVPLSGKRDVEWVLVVKLLAAVVLLGVIVILALPTGDVPREFSADSQEHQAEYRPQMDQRIEHVDMQGYRSAYRSSPGRSETSRNTGSAMILAREGADSSTQLPPGTRIRVSLSSRVVVSTQALPVIGRVLADIEWGSVLAIPKDSQIYGEVSFDRELKRGQINWRTVQFPNGRIRQLEALSTSLDGQAGVAGQIHSDQLKNTLGQVMTRFVGAYAQGSMQQSGVFGSPGGRENGMKNAVAETAKDQADRFADKLKKEREWLELLPNEPFFALLTQSFKFRDPGGSY